MHFTHRWLPWPLIVMWLAIAIGALSSCTADTREIDTAIASIKQTRVEVAAEIEKMKVEVAKSTLTPEQRAAWEKKLQTASDFLVKVESAEKKLDAVRDAAATGDPGAVIAAGGGAAAPLSGPYAPFVLLGSTLVGGVVSAIWKQRQVNAAQEAISTVSMLEAGGAISIPPDAKAILNEIQSEGAKRAVRAAQNRARVAMTVASKTPGRVVPKS